MGAKLRHRHNNKPHLLCYQKSYFYITQIPQFYESFRDQMTRLLNNDVCTTSVVSENDHTTLLHTREDQ